MGARPSSRYVLVASAQLTLTGAAVLLGWVLDVPWLERIAPAWPSMKVNTAACLLLAGLSLGALHSSAPLAWQLRLGRTLAAVVGLCAGLSLVEHLLHVNLGVDELLLIQPEADAPFPGRMSAATAAGLTVLALSLAGLHARALAVAWAARTAGLSVGVLGLLAVVNYWYGVNGLYGVRAFSTMALHTALLLLVAATGVLCIAPERGPLHFLVSGGVGSSIGRRLLPLAIALPLVTGWLRLLGQKAGLYNFEFGLALFATSNALSFGALIWATAVRLERTDEQRRRAEQDLAAAVLETSRLNSRLEERIAERTADLERANRTLRATATRLEDQNARLEHSTRDLEQFAYVASHDLQEPLRAIAGCAQILERRHRGKLDVGADELITHIVDGVLRMQALIRDLLAFSRIGIGTESPRTVDSGAEFGSALTRLERSIRQSSAVLTHDRLPTVMAVPGYLAQLFESLVGNALKYAGPHPPRIHVTAQRDGANWEFSVRDNGIGVEAQYCERIFNIFQRLHSREQYPGTGIGLAHCRKIVELHGGRIWLESALEKGSTFRFTIPSGEKQ